MPIWEFLYVHELWMVFYRVLWPEYIWPENWIKNPDPGPSCTFANRTLKDQFKSHVVQSNLYSTIRDGRIKLCNCANREIQLSKLCRISKRGDQASNICTVTCKQVMYNVVLVEIISPSVFLPDAVLCFWPWCLNPTMKNRRGIFCPFSWNFKPADAVRGLLTQCNHHAYNARRVS